MRWEDISEQTCSIAKASSVFGDRWTLLIVRQLFLGLRRFSDIQKSLGITKHRLTDRLNRLIEEGLVFKHLYDDKYNRFDYRLTEKGLDLYPVLITLAQWGDKWMCDGDGIPMQYEHQECGNMMTPTLCCSCCNKPLNLNNMKLKVGPGIAAKHARGDMSEGDQMLYKRLINEEG
ncbi:winged helix-turn-helix transcriptional regulator [Alteromonas facilis]|uniref:winged helix-turn-helix transcriptional regulator n=1 Tax=Alteromonas facilis TaxID=2048004 RepID=UPI000C283CF1|nr:helix-turn-helix domain-containing protein [Alteromonas facilis]